jgi:putative ABC transport system permease protein
MKRLSAGLRAAWAALWRGGRLDAAMHEEMRFHIDMEAERLEREHGLPPGEARRRAAVAFGGVEKYKEQGRDTRGLRWLDMLSLDAKLGARMLVKHRGLTLVGGFALAVATGIGATAFESMRELLDPDLPIANGDRVVSVRYTSSSTGRPERRTLHDFIEWRDELTSIRHLTAYRPIQHNLVASGAPPEPVKVAEITASGFAIAGTPPIRGRYLVPADERADSAPVVVVGHQAWLTRFGGDEGLVGRTITLGGTPHVVVGVMPEGFRFPIDDQFWTPFRANPLDHERQQGPQLHLFGVLAPGATMASAAAELETAAQRAAAASPRTHEHLRPAVLPFTREHLDLTDPAIVWLLRVAQLLVGALVFVVAINLAILFYARTVSRLGEIAVRTALGASRRRILGQLFTEALALSLVGTAAGLLLAGVALGRIQALLVGSGGTIPFWTEFSLSMPTALYALGLAVLAALVMGVLPGVKATGGRIAVNLQELSGRSGSRLGPLWTTLVVAQVAVAVAVLPAAIYLSWLVVRMEVAGPGFDASRFVVARVAPGDGTDGVDPARARARQLELLSRLEAEPGVAAVTFSSGVPGFGPGGRRVEFEEGAPIRPNRVPEVSYLDVDPALFEVYGARFLAGRGFADDDADARTVIVNHTFVERYFEASAARPGSAIGLRFRYTRGGDEPWHEVVGVVADFPAFSAAPRSEGEPTVYHPARRGDVHPVIVSARFAGPLPPAVGERFRRMGAEVDPALQISNVRPLSTYYDDVRAFWRHLAWGLGMVTASVLLLSAAGIHALLAFTVAQRRREIGIRLALGAPPRRLLFGIFGRVLRQVGLGVLIGSLLSSVVVVGEYGLWQAAVVLGAVMGVMLLVGLGASVGPARRSLRVQATEALRAEG